MARILFVQPQKFAYPGLYHICGALRDAGHAYKVLTRVGRDHVAREMDGFRPDVVGFTTLTGLHRPVLDLAAWIKQAYPHVRTLFGGVHATLFPQIIEAPFVDFVCRGEGELPTRELLDAIDRGDALFDIPNITWKFEGEVRETPLRPFVDPLDSLPFPDHSVYAHEPAIAGDDYPMVVITRGCPFSCGYCHNSRQKEIYRGCGRYVRSFSHERIFAEVESQLTVMPKARVVFLLADTLGHDIEWLTDLLEGFSERFDVGYTCMIRPEFITEELVRLLRDTRCAALYFGIESGSERVRRELLGRRYTNAQVLEAARLLRQYGIKFRTFNIVGFPSETREEMLETLDLTVRVQPDYPWCSIYTPYPETTLIRYCLDNGFLDGDFSYDDVPSSYFNGTVLKNVDKNFISNLHSWFQLLVLAPWLIPFVKPLLPLAPSRFYRVIFKLIYGMVCIRAEKRGLRSFVRLALANRELFR